MINIDCNSIAPTLEAHFVGNRPSQVNTTQYQPPSVIPTTSGHTSQAPVSSNVEKEYIKNLQQQIYYLGMY
jgi:hypothetical protein